MGIEPDRSAASLSLTAPAKRDLTSRNAGFLYTRIAWVAVFVLSISLYVASIPVHYQRILSFSTPWQSNIESISLLGISTSAYAMYALIAATVSVLVFVLVGVMIFWAGPHDRMALFCSLVLITFGVAWPNTLISLLVYEQRYPALAVLIHLFNGLSFGLFFWLFYLFPSGSFVPRWTVIIASIFLITILGTNFFPGTLADSNSWSPVLGLGVAFAFIATMIYAQVYRYSRISTPIQRQQTKWVVYSLIIVVASFVVGGVATSIEPFNRRAESAAVFALGADIIFLLLFMLIPISIGIAVLRYRLWEIDLLVNRTLVYGALTISVGGIYVLIVAYLSSAFQTDPNTLISFLAAAVLAVIFQPLRERLQRGVNLLMYGHRDKPYAVISRLGQQVEMTPRPDDILVTLLETVAEALKLPFAAIEFANNSARAPSMAFYPPAAGGLPPANTLRMPLHYQSQSVGHLLVSPRSSNESFSPADIRLLKTIASHVGTSVHAVQLSVDLQRSRSRIVTAREEERRRIRRDLHDGLGTSLAGLAIQVDEARELAHTDPQKTEMLLIETTKQVQLAIADIRRLVYGLRPSSLDELGLAGALSAQVENLQNVLEITLDIPPSLPSLSAAVEVAVFRITQEALTNVIRHAQAKHCRVRLVLDDKLRLEISDDGIGLADRQDSGVGLDSLRERAEELGGSFLLESAPGDGTRMIVQLPTTVFDN